MSQIQLPLPSILPPSKRKRGVRQSHRSKDKKVVVVPTTFTSEDVHAYGDAGIQIAPHRIDVTREAVMEHPMGDTQAEELISSMNNTDISPNERANLRTHLATTMIPQSVLITDKVHVSQTPTPRMNLSHVHGHGPSESDIRSRTLEYHDFIAKSLSPSKHDDKKKEDKNSCFRAFGFVDSVMADFHSQGGHQDENNSSSSSSTFVSPTATLSNTVIPSRFVADIMAGQIASVGNRDLNEHARTIVASEIHKRLNHQMRFTKMKNEALARMRRDNSEVASKICKTCGMSFTASDHYSPLSSVSGNNKLSSVCCRKCQLHYLTRLRELNKRNSSRLSSRAELRRQNRRRSTNTNNAISSLYSGEVELPLDTQLSSVIDDDDEDLLFNSIDFILDVVPNDGHPPWVLMMPVHFAFVFGVVAPVWTTRWSENQNLIVVPNAGSSLTAVGNQFGIISGNTVIGILTLIAKLDGLAANPSDAINGWYLFGGITTTTLTNGTVVDSFLFRPTRWATGMQIIPNDEIAVLLGPSQGTWILAGYGPGVNSEDASSGCVDSVIRLSPTFSNVPVITTIARSTGVLCGSRCHVCGGLERSGSCLCRSSSSSNAAAATTAALSPWNISETEMTSPLTIEEVVDIEMRSGVNK